MSLSILLLPPPPRSVKPDTAKTLGALMASDLRWTLRDEEEAFDEFEGGRCGHMLKALPGVGEE